MKKIDQPDLQNPPTEEAYFTADVVHFDRMIEHANGGVHYPLHPSTQYTYNSVADLINVFQGKSKGNSPYSRQGTPTTAVLEAKLAKIEEGCGAVAFATGMGAIAATFLTLVKAGDHIVVSEHLFGNTASFFNTLENLGILVTRVNATAVQNVAAAIQDNTRIVFVETVANPGTQVPDLMAIGELCEQLNIVYVVDNTILSAYLFKPKSVKASLVIHSLTKSAAGQGQVLGGVVIDTGLYDWQKYPNIFVNYRKGDASKWGLQQIRKKGLRDMGATLSSHAAHQISLGLETLAIRMQRSSATALTVARFLQQHPKVAKVYYPMLEDHNAYQQACRLFKAGSWLFSFELVDADQCLDFVDKLEVFIKATGLGDTRSLIIPVAHTIFWEMGAQKRQAMQISDGMLRVSIGLEESECLLGDLAQALG
ncbi:MAG: cystathionine gamma-synthase family protein [Pseudomonadales bacterium]|nr:cystathionine gamma-synthase family protein [Pseudomonadales bacterium]NRA15129.1 cystathionine gamma-synthase family protein [Oceanospirillaceae bacterium]